MAALTKSTLLVIIGTTEYHAQLTKCEIDSAAADNDTVTFADAAAGGARQYTLEATVIQDLATGSLWDQIWSNSGTTVSCTLKPYGNTTASATQPWYTFSAVITDPDGTLIGGEADASVSAKQTVDISWSLTAKPVKVTS